MVIGITTLLGAIALAVVGSLTFWPIKTGWDFYIPIVLFIGGYIAMLLVWWVIVDISGRILGSKKDRKKISKYARFLLTDTMRYIDNHALALVKVVGKHKVPTSERFLFVQNHTSRFDPMVTNAYFNKYDIAFITKPSNTKIPLAKRILPALFYQGIVREDPIQSLGVMKNSIELITNNITSIGVYPEGTRHKDGELGEFHEGVFNICLKAKCPLVVSVIKNANKIAKNFPFKITKVTLEIIDVITYEQMEGKTAKALSDEVKQMMLKHLA